MNSSNNYDLKGKISSQSDIILESKIVSDSKPLDEKSTAGPKKSDTYISNILQPTSSIAVSKHKTVETKTSKIVTSTIPHLTQGKLSVLFYIF